ncbi:hypothetical protein [Sulfobacillus harzensis]|uniref:Histidine kinase N-terminal 7TM region domain-containing protein n=1 Tax=Sulfobacillus harzensis TaxID=2729629 RepID=A0A7Y0L9E1_9FIRM|nr:hypothetical protein [Sulfobacillus harzensis]NMP24930.1 hypothetical protein [Sulfobacillus harzensis]
MASGLYAAAAALALVFVLRLVQRLRTSRAPVYLWWSLSFALYALAFIMEALTVDNQWHVWEYQVYMIGSAGLVGAMSVGTTYLAWPRSKIAAGYALYFVVVELALVVLAIVYPPTLHGTWALLNAGHAIVGPPRIAYLMLSAVGGPIVVIGAGWSWWKTRRYPILLIAVGALIPSLAGTLASQGLTTSVFPILNIIGLILIFIGYLNPRPPSRRPTASASRPRS